MMTWSIPMYFCGGAYVTELFIEKSPADSKITHREVPYEESEVIRSAARFPTND